VQVTRLFTCALVSAVSALGLAAAVKAERPGWFTNPSITGQPRVGAALLGSPGGIKCEPGCVGLVHEWSSCSGPGPAGADRPTGGLPFDGRPAPGCVLRTRGDLNYEVRPEDAGRHIQLRVVATNYDCGNVRTDGAQECNYSSGSGYSATIGPISGAVPPTGAAPGAVAPRNAALPGVRGPLRVAQTVAVSRGDWSGTDPLRFSYQWLHCSSALGGCPPIAGATGATYTIRAADVGTRIAVIVIAANRAGSTWATAPARGPVLPADAQPGAVLDVKELLPAQRLAIAAVEAPRVVRPAGTFRVRVRVTHNRRFLISGALVEVSGNRGEVRPASAKTGASGVAVVHVRVRAVRPRAGLVLTVKALKSRSDRLPAVKRISLTVRP
jgi:hypothetical protein